MKSIIIINFLALLWACFAAEETVPTPEENTPDPEENKPKNLRGRELMAEMKDMCADLRSYGYGRYTFQVSGAKARWSRRWPYVTLGPCPIEDVPHTKSELKTEVWCRWFGSTRNGQQCNMYVPAFMGDWLQDTGATYGPCKGKSGDTIFMDYDKAIVVDDNVLCMDIDGLNDFHSVVVSDVEFNWFSDRAEYDGECTVADEPTITQNTHPRDYCVKIDGLWYDIETDRSFKAWLIAEADDFEPNPCISLFTSEGTISMYHLE